MHVLQLLHDSLEPGGLVVDTQPVGASAVVDGGGGPLGELDLREWVGTIAAIDGLVDEVLDAGLFRLEHEERFLVTDSAEDPEDLLESVGEWQQTRIPAGLPARVRASEPPFTVVQDVRLRLFRSAASG